MSSFDEFGWNYAVPDVIGEVVAWRCWHYNTRMEHLNSVHKPHYWIPRTTQVARCPDGVFEGPPGTRCRCGFYALKSLDYDYLVNAGYNTSEVWGLVALSGRIIEGTVGYRAERARPLRLWVSPYVQLEKVTLLGSVYDIPAERWEWDEDAYTECDCGNPDCTNPDGNVPYLHGADEAYAEAVRLCRGGELDGDRRDDQGVHDRTDP